MAEPFKNAFNTEMIAGMAAHFLNHYPAFDDRGFVAAACNGLDALELKARSEQITAAMAEHLPADFAKAGAILLASLSPAVDGDIFAIGVDDNGIAGWAIMPISHYVGLYGHEHFELSMMLLKEMTKRFSSEFAIRFFLLASPDETVSILRGWLPDKKGT